MKIIHVITWLQKAAGTSVFCGEVSNGLVAAGQDVTIAVVDPKQKDCYPLDSRIKLISISSLLSDSSCHACSTWLNYDLIHIHALWEPILHKVAVWARRHHLPIVWSPHGMLTPWAMNNKKWKKRLAWWLYQSRDLKMAVLLHATAQSEVEDIRRMGVKKKVVVAPLGVRLGPLTQGNGKTNKTLLFVSRVQRKKGLLSLAMAWSMLPQQLREGWRVRIVGPDQEGHSQEVRTECERLGISADWDFVGPRYGNGLQEEYSNANLFVLPSFSENFGSVVIEALAHGVPVITTKGTPWKELDDYKCGWWIDIGVQPLANALNDAMSLTDIGRREIGARGESLIEAKYTWDSVVRAVLKGYEEVLSAKT